MTEPDAHDVAGSLDDPDVVATLRLMERRLRESEERLRIALWAAGMICWDWDVPAGQVRVTGSLGTLADLDALGTGHLAPSQAADVHPADRASVAAADRRTPDDGADYEVEFRVRGADGEERWVAQLGRVVERDASGRVKRVAGVVMDVTERCRLQQELAHRASHVPLTDLPNRALFLERLAAAVDRAEGDDLSPAVLFLDLDGFKAVNDCYGHDAGDRLLVAVAKRLRASVPADATIARLGGDEFAVLIEGADAAEAEAMAGAIADALRRPVVLDGREVRVAVSVGVAPGYAVGSDPVGLLRAADAALYRAKAAAPGGNGRERGASPSNRR